MKTPLTRPCCGQKHWGPVCPDGLLMCQECLVRVPKDRLAVDNGCVVDACIDCGMSAELEVHR